jgi:A/G-specific adenine glycosylase
MLCAMDARTAHLIGRRLLAWYGKSARDLPWRHSPTPYGVWVSEVMLQQTVVATVIPYFERWMARFPDVASLASADEREALAAWEGLGYYRRALNLRRAARLAMEGHGGRVPSSQAALLNLPGVGPYIASAIRSLAFGKDEVALDANVARVFLRLLGLRAEAGDATARRAIRGAAEQALPPGRSGDYNQALMDFGSLICRPRRPRCADCFLAEKCEAFRRGLQHDVPQRTAGTLKRIRTVVAVFVTDGRVYVQKRPPGGLFEGMWEFPGGKVQGGETPRRALARECREELGASVTPGRKLAELTHYYTVFEVRLRAFLCPAPPELPEDEAHRWVPLGELDRYPMPSANRRIVAALEAHAQGQGSAPVRRSRRGGGARRTRRRARA